MRKRARTGEQEDACLVSDVERRIYGRSNEAEHKEKETIRRAGEVRRKIAVGSPESSPL
jgi:hypothetical protein